MNIHTYLEKRAKKMPLNQRVVEFISDKIVPPVGAGVASVGDAAIRAIGTPIKSLRMYEKPGRKRAADLISKSKEGEKLTNAAIVGGAYGGDIATRVGMGYGAYKGGKKIKKYLQDKKRGK